MHNGQPKLTVRRHCHSH